MGFGFCANAFGCFPLLNARTLTGYGWSSFLPLPPPSLIFGPVMGDIPEQVLVGKSRYPSEFGTASGKSASPEWYHILFREETGAVRES